MTEGMDLPQRLMAQPEEIAAAVALAVETKQDIIYVRPIWRLIMLLVHSKPEKLFKNMRL